MQRTKTSSWPSRYSSIEEKTKAVSKVMDFVQKMWSAHFKGSADVWTKPPDEKIKDQAERR